MTERLDEAAPCGISIARATQVLFWAAIAFAVASVVAYVARYSPGFTNIVPWIDVDPVYWFGLDEERNLPTFFSAGLLLICSLLLAGIAIHVNATDKRFLRRWQLLAVLFLMFSVDETVGFHERLNDPVLATLNTGGVFYFAWVIPGLLLVMAVGLFYLSFLLNLDAKIRSLFILAASLYVGGTIGVEMVGGYYVSNYGRDNLTYTLITTVEETLEMLGLVAFIHALLTQLALSKAQFTARP